MINFTHKASCPDGTKSVKVAKLIKRRAKLKKNVLAHLLRRHLVSNEGTGMFKSIQLSDVDDMVRLKRKTLINKIFLGKYQLKLCKSYLGYTLHD